MPIKFKCPSCDQMLAIARRKSGSVISCPRCSYPATVPANEGETARPAAVGRPEAARPAFERGDFDRWIGGRRPAGASGGATLLAEPPLPSLSETHTGLLDSHRERRQRESTTPVIDVRLATALILGAGLLAFAGGYVVGRNSSFVRPLHVGAANPAPETGKAAPADAASTAAKEPKFVLNGTIEFRTSKGNVADAGARILAFPTTQKPLKKISSGGLKPGDEKALDQTGVEGLMKLGGAVATADANGSYSISLPKEGAYWVLVMSKNVSRPGPLTLQLDQSKLYDYFADPNSVLGDRDFALAVRRATPNEAVPPYSPVFRPVSP